MGQKDIYVVTIYLKSGTEVDLRASEIKFGEGKPIDKIVPADEEQVDILGYIDQSQIEMIVYYKEEESF